MTKRVEAVGEFDATYTDCPACDEEVGMVVLKEFVLGIVGAQQHTFITMRADVHERATGHQVLIVDQRKPL